MPPDDPATPYTPHHTDECRCRCHQPGSGMMHCMPCCAGECPACGIFVAFGHEGYHFDFCGMSICGPSSAPATPGDDVSELARLRAEVERLKQYEPMLVPSHFPREVAVSCAHGFFAHIVKAFEELNGQANYSVTEVRTADELAYEVMVRRKDKPTPHELRKKAEADRDAHRAAAQEAEAERDALRAENERLWTNTGVGGYAGDAPEEMYVSGLADHGCDAWIHLVRVQVIEGKTNERQAAKMAEGQYTQPVRYVRADEADALRRAVGAYHNLLARIFRDGGQRQDAIGDDVRAGEVAEGIVVGYVAALEFYRDCVVTPNESEFDDGQCAIAALAPAAPPGDAGTTAVTTKPVPVGRDCPTCGSRMYPWDANRVYPNAESRVEMRCVSCGHRVPM